MSQQESCQFAYAAAYSQLQSSSMALLTLLLVPNVQNVRFEEYSSNNDGREHYFIPLLSLTIKIAQPRSYEIYRILYKVKKNKLAKFVVIFHELECPGIFDILHSENL